MTREIDQAKRLAEKLRSLTKKGALPWQYSNYFDAFVVELSKEHAVSVRGAEIAFWHGDDGLTFAGDWVMGLRHAIDAFAQAQSETLGEMCDMVEGVARGCDDV